MKNKKNIDLKVEIGNNKSKQWTEAEVGEFQFLAKDNANQRRDEQKIKNELMAIRYEVEEYINDNRAKPLTIEKVVSDYLDVLNLSFRKFAINLDTTDSNLRKYLSGERKFNADLAMKFSCFFHTPAEIWLQLQLKNELSELKKEKKQVRHYERYDYRKAIGIVE